jgi:hypothetical protein
MTHECLYQRHILFFREVFLLKNSWRLSIRLRIILLISFASGLSIFLGFSALAHDNVPAGSRHQITGELTGSYKSLDEAVAALNSHSGTHYTIAVTTDAALRQTLPINEGKHVTIVSAGGVTRTIIQSGGRHFSLRADAHLILENIILQGMKGEAFPESGGIELKNASLILNHGAVIRNCQTTGDGGGISAYSSTLMMNGAVISGCTAVNGGGLAAFDSAIDMNHAVIEECSAVNGDGIYLANGSTLRSDRPDQIDKSIIFTEDDASMNVFKEIADNSNDVVDPGVPRSGY